MKHLFDKTKEVAMDAFKAIWAHGGYKSIGNQYSNGDKSEYLLVFDRKAEELRDRKLAEVEAFRDSIPTYTMMGIGKHPVNPEDEIELRAMIDELNNLSAKTQVTNVAEVFDAGWVSHSAKAVGAKTKKVQVPDLPEDWDTVTLVYEVYPVYEHKVVARNNHDGTVQLFRA